MKNNLLFKKYLTCIVLMLGMTAFAQFSGSYAPSNWTTIKNTLPSDGYVDVSGAVGTIIIGGDDDGSGGCCDQYVAYSITVCATGNISFNYSHSNSDIDYAYYSINGARTLISTNGSGSVGPIAVTAGAVFQFMVVTQDDCCGRGVLTITNFSATLNTGTAPTTPSLIPNVAFCIGAPTTTTLSIASGTLNSGTTWEWYKGSCAGILLGTGTTLVVSPAATTVYYARGTGACSFPGSCNSVTVTVNPLPIIAVNSGTICSGKSFTMIPSGANTYTYSSGSSVTTPVSNTSYSVTGTSSAGCISTAAAVSSVTLIALPVVSLPSSTLCFGQSITMVPGGASTYTFSSGSALVSPTINTSYSVTGTSAVGCVSSNTAVNTITVYALPVITVNSGTVCSGLPFTMSPGGAVTYTYSSGSAIVSPLTNTSYSVSGTSSLGCLSSLSAVSSVTVIALPIVTVNNGTICLGQTFTMIPGGAISYTYSNGSNTVSPSTNTSYSITGTSSVGCISTSPAISSLTVYAIPAITVNSGTICSGKSFTMVPGGANTYTYTGGSAVVSPLTNSSYSVTGTSTAGCLSSIAAVSSVTVIALPLISVNSGSICAGQSFTMVPSGASTYTYSNGSNVATPLSTVGYSITGTSAVGCLSSNTAVSTVTVYSVPLITITSGTICNGQSFTMLAGGAGTYTYSSGSSIVSPSINTSYSVTGTSTAGCLGSNTAVSTVTVYAIPVITANSGTICSGKSFTIIPGGANTYSFTGGSAIVSPLANSSYSVTGTSTAGCLSTAAAVSAVTVIALPLISVNSGSICTGQSFTMIPSGASTYTYSNGSNVVTPLTTLGYSVTGTSSVGCIGSNTAVSTVTVNAVPTITVNSGPICFGKSFTITPGGASTYTITGGNAIVSPTSNTSYSVIGTSSAGCVGSNTATSSVTVNALPTVSVTSGVICIGSSFTMIPSGASTYTYSNGNNVVSPSSNLNYSVTGTNSLGCVSSNTAVSTVSVNALPVLAINATSAICTDNSASLTVNGASTYSWSTNQFTASIIVSPTVTTSYSVIATNSNNCVNTAAYTLTVYALPTIAISGNTAICIGNTATLSVSGGSLYIWNTTATTSTISNSPTITTTYSVMGTDLNGCSNSANQTVIVNALPVIVITGANTICIGNTAGLSASGASTYVWSTTDVTSTIVASPSITTTYSVVGTDLNGCKNSSSQIVTVNALPVITFVNTKSVICAGESNTVMANGGLTYSWSTNQSDSVITIHPTSTTSYTVMAYFANGCMNSAVTTQSVSDCTGISALKGNTKSLLTIYPNPNRGDFTITCDENIQVSIVNDLGQVVQTLSLNETNNKNISISNLANGIYFIVGSNNSQVISQKIIVAK